MADVSFSLYHYLCTNIVGTENHVKTIRLMNTVSDNLSGDDKLMIITSGSFGEGLQMRGSDLDIMRVFKQIEVYEKMTATVFNPTKIYFSLLTEDTKPGFAMLRLIRSPHPIIRIICEKFKGDNYLSNVLFKQLFLSEMSPVVHGPCVSDIRGRFDFAHCLHSKYWVTSASQWTTRSTNSWPDENTKHAIINHGVLLVPIGAKGSLKEELEWRISFSVAEKFLIYAFSHSQLLCYALMKILLSDIINYYSRCKHLLCSYYLKTIMFWISTELEPSVWTPDKLIPCFMKCFHRLIYCVEYSVCPHYFIPQNNLFENRIEGVDRDNLIDTLRVFFNYGWRCLLFSKQISQLSVLSCNVHNDQSCLYEDINKLLKSNVFIRFSTLRSEHNICKRSVYNIIYCVSKKMKYFHAYFMSLVCNIHCQSVYLSSTISNKIQYKQYKTSLSYLLMNINHDTVSGWLMLASFFYRANQYKKSLKIILYALSKCTLDKIFLGTELSVVQRLLIKWTFEQKQGVVRLFKFVLVDGVSFKNSTFIPMELLIEGSNCKIPPVVYAHVLSFLCHYHLNNVRECRNFLQDLQLTIVEDYFIRKDKCLKAYSYYCLGTVLHLMGDNESAKQAFTETFKLAYRHPYLIKQLRRLSMIASL